MILLIIVTHFEQPISYVYLCTFVRTQTKTIHYLLHKMQNYSFDYLLDCLFFSIQQFNKKINIQQHKECNASVCVCVCMCVKQSEQIIISYVLYIYIKCILLFSSDSLHLPDLIIIYSECIFALLLHIFSKGSCVVIRRCNIIMFFVVVQKWLQQLYYVYKISVSNMCVTV